MLTRLADVSYRRRWLVVALWVATLVGLTVARGAWGGEFGGNARLEGTDSQRAYDLFAERFPSKSGETASAVFAVDGDLRAEGEAIEAFLAEVRTVAGVDAVVSPFETDGQISDDGTIAFATIEFASGQDDLLPTVEEITSLAQPLRDAGVRTEFASPWFLEGGLPESELFGLAAAAVILLLAFGSVIAAGLPLVTAVIGIGSGLAGIGLWAAVVDTPDFTVQVASMIGIGVGIDYALFIVTRFREARGRGLDPHAATIEAVSTAGRAVVFAGLTVMISLLGMILMRLSFLNGLALGSSTAVAIAVMAAVTLLPALLGIVGGRITPMRVAASANRSIWVRWSHLIQRRPVPAAVVGVVVLVALGAPALALRLGTADAGSDAAEQTTRKAYDLLAEGFSPGFNGPFVLAADLRGVAGGIAALAPTIDALRATAGVAFVSEPQPNPAGDAAVVTVIPTTAPQEQATDDLLHDLRDRVLPETTAGTGVEASIGGMTASNVDFAWFIAQRLPWFIGAVLVCSFLLLLVTFRSVLVPLKAVVMNLLSIGAAYGVMVAVFQWGWAGSLFGVGKGAPIEPWAPMMLFAIVFGLSMDYEVFLLSKIREHYVDHGDNGRAVAEGLAGTARVISAAAAIMVFVFGFFVFGELRAIKLIGLGLATAVFIDATIVRLVLVPATMELLGDRNWWLPRWLDRLVPDVHLEGATPAAVAASSRPTVEEPELASR